MVTRKMLYSLFAVLFSLALPVAAQKVSLVSSGLDWSKEKPVIKVQVTGQVKVPGIHDLRAYDRLADAVSAAGGTTEQASIRTVYLIRDGQTIDTLDLYKYLVENHQGENPEIKDGDVVFVPLANDMVTVYGQVMKPGKYEVKPGERLMDVIVMAGGLTPYASMEFIKIQNFIMPDSVTSIDIRRFYFGHDAELNLEVKNGDMITVPTRPTTVTVVGQVQKGGTFAYEPGTILSYYLGMAGGYSERASTSNIRINRWGGRSLKARDNTMIEPGDVVVVGELQLKGWRDYITVISQVVTTFFIVWQVSRQ